MQYLRRDNFRNPEGFHDIILGGHLGMKYKGIICVNHCFLKFEEKDGRYFTIPLESDSAKFIEFNDRMGDQEKLNILNHIFLDATLGYAKDVD